MEKKKLKQKKKYKSKKMNFLSHFCICTSRNDETEDSNLRAQTVVSFQPAPPPSMMATKHEVSVTYRTASLYSYGGVLSLDNTPTNAGSPNVLSPNALLSQAYTEKMEKREKRVETIGTQKSPPPTKKPNIEREQKDELVKTILSKYLAMKRAERLNKKPETENEGRPSSKPLQPKKSDFLSVECFSSGSSETLLLDSTSNYDVTKPNADFTTKSRSAPTTSTAHDSLADICFKMNRFKQQENKSDSYVTCCSEETTAAKKKLELIFNESSEEVLSCRDDSSSVSLRYKISCEKTPVTAGSPRADSVVSFYDSSRFRCESRDGFYLQPQEFCDDSSNECDYVKRKKEAKFASPQLQRRPSANGEFGGVRGSTASLKWKLIISHHDQGDIAHA
jgi:hypothetical protein